MSSRIILLFDLDCFYAQCERVRLGLPEDVSLALLQWDSVLAVTYPARNLHQIKRGDSWETVDRNSSSQCWTIHLPILSRQQEFEIFPSYESIYKMSREEQLECQQRERGVRQSQNQGKACLERYRMASMRIFEVVLESLQKHLGKGQFVLERASIDEFYLDITEYCNNSSRKFEEESISNDNAKKSTVVVGTFARDSIHRALKQACLVSSWVRQDVRDELGFTMSTGISTNKMMAKLAASHGKPNGQAMVHPCAFSSVLATTKLSKVRNFGGKLGKEAQQLVDRDNSDDIMMGELQQFSVLQLKEHFSSHETAQFVFDVCRGIDKESVKETKGALVQSITAFKSFPATNCNDQIQSWLKLLAREIVLRVCQDTTRHGRHPKVCTLSYTYYTTPNGQRPQGIKSTRSQRQSRSIRLGYHPPERLVSQAMERLVPIIKQHPLRGVGLSANSFESKGGVAIDRFFFQTAKRKEISPHSKMPKVEPLPSQKESQETIAIDHDLELAKKLQASYDREDTLWSRVQSIKKIRKIDSFFGKR
mmetsp:Transcript_8000/g.11563  ORF Transcript_8000/g.11563 Transcript_8000/m.11563 type:complete len:536 (+) Transcript_8000:67-1674(+)